MFKNWSMETGKLFANALSRQIMTLNLRDRKLNVNGILIVSALH